MRVRRPVVSGIFYPSGKDELIESIRECFSNGPKASVKPKSSDERKSTREGRVTTVVSPHAAYMYSGSVAAYSYYHAYKHVEPDTIIMVGPNHYGLGSGIASMKDYYWETPLGMVRVDDGTVDGIVRYSGIMDIDDYAHSRDHCLEVQLPMLQYIYDYEFTIVPIVIWMQDKGTAVELGRAIAEVSKDIIGEGKDVLLIASSDLTHYEPHEQAVRKDSELIDTMKELDINRYYAVLERLNISACGYGAIASIMEACRSLGFSKGILLKYATSGDITEDRSSVVGYPSVAFI